MTTTQNHTDHTALSSSAILAQALRRLFGRSMGVSRILMKLGFEGYGVYCAVIELLCEQANYRYIIDYNLIAFAIGADAEMVSRVVRESGMFCEETDNGVRYLYLPELRDANAQSVRTSATVPCPTVSHAGTVGQVGTVGQIGTVGQVGRDASTTAHPESQGNYSLSANRAMLRSDMQWLARVGATVKFKPEIMPAVFDAFADYVVSRDDIRYQSQTDMTKHFCNWLLKGCGNKAANRAQHAAMQEKEAELRREQQRERERQQREHASRSITYAEYCRQCGIESTGSMVEDMARRVAAARSTV